MCGSATLAMVVSSTCSSTAIITPMVTIIRWPVGSTCVGLAGRVAIGAVTSFLVEIDRGGDRQAGDHRLRRIAVERDPDRHALGHLDPIAVGVLGREQREFAAGAGADALDMCGELLARVGVDLDLARWPGTMRPTSFSLKFASTHAVCAVDEREHAEPGDGHLADLEVVGILDDAVHRRAKFGPRQVELGLVDRGLCLGDLRLFAGRDRGMGVRGAGAARRRGPARRSALR